MIAKIVGALLILCAASSPVIAQNQAPPSADILARMTRGGIDDYIVGALDRWTAGTTAFRATVGAYCTAPSPTGRTSLRSSFTTLLTGWAGVDFLQFGPLSRDGRADRFAFWPDPHGTGERQLRLFLTQRDAAILAPGALAKESAAVQGLPALERVLFEGGEALVVAANPEPFRCDLAKAIAANLDSLATTVRDEWRGEKGWRALMLAPQHDNPVYIKPEEPVIELMKALLSGIERLADQRIMPARGVSAQAGRASRAPYALSGATPAYWRASGESLTRFAEALHLTDFIPQASAALGADAKAQFGKLRDGLAGAGDNVEAALTAPGPRAKLGDALAALQRLRALVGTEIPGATGLTTGFNALDGD